MFLPLFRRHAALIKRAFQDVSSEELHQLEAVLKKIGERVESLPKKGRFSAWIRAVESEKVRPALDRPVIFSRSALHLNCCICIQRQGAAVGVFLALL